MGYFDEIRQASFKGIEFEAFTAKSGGGRRGTVNEYPGSNDADFIDKGGKTKPFTLNAAVFGEDALTKAEQLEEKLGQPGAGRLVHPVRRVGEMQAICTDFQRTSVSNNGERVEFLLEFFRQPERTTGVRVAQNPGKTAETQRTNTNKESAANFIKTFRVSGQPAFIFQEAKNNFINMTLPMTQFLGDTQPLVNAYLAQLDGLLADPEKLIESTQQLINDSVRVASSSNVGFRSITSATSNAFNNAATLQGFSTEFENIPITTNTRQIQQANAKATQLAVRQTATVVESDLHLADEGQTLFKTREQAQQNLKTLLKNMQIRKNESADIAANMSQLMATTATASNAQYGLLADQRKLKIPTNTNTLVLAYQLYEDFNREQEIRTFNNLVDNFVAKSSTLNVLES